MVDVIVDGAVHLELELLCCELGRWEPVRVPVDDCRWDGEQEDQHAQNILGGYSWHMHACAPANLDLNLRLLSLWLPDLSK